MSMSKKIPCGGFELGESLEVKDGKLDLVEGAGGVQSDWNVNDPDAAGYIKNRICYDNNKVFIDTVLENSSSDAYGTASESIEVNELAVGHTYILEVDGIRHSYDLSYAYVSSNNFSWLYLGGYPDSSSTIHGPDIGIYIPVEYNNVPDVYSGKVYFYREDKKYPCSVKLYEVASDKIKQIDPKYIPSQRFDVTISEDDDGNLVSDKTPAEILEAYNNGQIVNGTIDKFGINLSLSNFVNNGVGVIFTATDSYGGFVNFFEVNNDRTVFERDYLLIQPADDLPNGQILTTTGGMWGPSDSLILPSTNFVLPSSTSGSTKKFKITVDDTGTISATEYTT